VALARLASGGGDVLAEAPPADLFAGEGGASQRPLLPQAPAARGCAL